MSKLYVKRSGLWVPVTDEDHRADSNPHPGVVVLEGDARLSDARVPTGHHTSHESGGSDAIKLDDLAAPDDTTDLNVSTTKHGLMVKLPNDSTKVFDGSGIWRKPTYASVWDGRAVPSGLHADSDELTTGSVDASWSDWDHGAWITTTVESPPNRMVHTGTANANSRAAGKYKAVPSSEFQFIAQVGVDGAAGGTAGTNAWLVGLAVFANAASSGAALASVELVNNNPDTGSICTLNQRAWTDYTGPGSPLFRNTMMTMVWLRMRVLIAGATTTVGNDWSTDGVNWSQIGATARSLGYAAAHYGLICNSNVNTNVIRVYHSHFRVWSASGASGFNYANNGNFLGN